MFTEQTWRDISRISSVRDFKQATFYRLTGNDQYVKVGPGGEIGHGTFGQLSYTNQADTYGRMVAITRQDIINDDLGALADKPRSLGRGAGLAMNDVFWTAFLDNSSFFTSGNSNYFTGASTNLQHSSLEQAQYTLARQTDADGKPLGADGRILLVPPEVQVTADELFTSTNLNTGGAASTAKVPNRNVFIGRYRPVMSRYLSNSTYTGYSTTAWYLLCDPNDIPVMRVVLLNGRDAPVVETAEADFSTLGIQMRGYHDLGCAKEEYRGGVKSRGAA